MLRLLLLLKVDLLLLLSTVTTPKLVANTSNSMLMIWPLCRLLLMVLMVQ